jgi:hypothetical protein
MGVPIDEDGALKNRTALGLRGLWRRMRPRGDEFRLPRFVVFS